MHAVAAVAAAAMVSPQEVLAAVSKSGKTVPAAERFPYFQSTPVPYFNVKMLDTYWAPRQKTVRDVTVAWASAHYDEAGGLDAYKRQPQAYQPKIRAGDLEANKFIESMAAVVGLERDAAIEGMAEAWGQKFIDAQAPDGYSVFGYPLGADPSERWRVSWISHEDYAHGHYLESAIGYKESTGKDAMYRSAVRAMDNMADTFLGSDRAYAPGHQEIEQALMRLYGLTGDTKYLQLCGWLIEQRGRHQGRESFGKYSQDHIPIREQRTIEGHAVRASFLFNGVTEYAGATGDAGYKESMLAIWNDFVDNKMYVHGGGGNASAKNEGYSSKPNHLPIDDCYGESCSVFGNFQWAHNLSRLTGDAAPLDVAERMLYNAFYASLSLQGDRFFYHNVISRDEPVLRFAWHHVPCCPPNIVKLFSKVGGFFYATDRDGVFIKHYGASEADIPLRNGNVKLIQRTEYPWNGDVHIEVQPKKPSEFAVRLRVPAWAKTHAVSVNGKPVSADVQRGWVSVRRKWKEGDRIELNLPMEIERLTMPERFKDYAGKIALRRGPIVYCLEGQDVSAPFSSFYIPAENTFTSEYRPDLLGGVTVLHGKVSLARFTTAEDAEVSAMFVPYGLWNNRTPGWMSVWFGTSGPQWEELLNLPHPPDEAV